jgi:ribonuclease Z
MGLIFTYHLQNRSEDLHVYGPKGLDEIITLQLKYSESKLSYDIKFHLIETGGQFLFENEDIEIHSVEMNHRIPCFGLVFQEKKRKYRLIREALPESLTKENLIHLKDGLDIIDLNGKIWLNSDLALPPHEPRKYVYFSDTRIFKHKVEAVENANLLYHESTFMNDMQERAETTFHSTAEEAARFAHQNNVKELLIGHYSSRYYDVHPFLMEAKKEFQETKLAMEGQTYEIKPLHATKEKQINIESQLDGKP